MRLRRGTAAAGLALMVALAAPPVARAEPAEGSISLASQTPWLGAGDPFGVRLDIDGVTRPEALDVEVEVHRAVRTRSQFVQTVSGHLLGSLAAPSVVQSLSTLPFDAAGAVQLRVDLPDLKEGVYPVRVVLRDRESHEVADEFVTHLVRVPSGDVADPLRVAWVQPVDAGVTLQPDGSRRLTPTALRSVDRIAAALADTADVPLSLDLSPDTVDGLFAAGRTDLLTEIGHGLGHRQLLGSSYVSVDASALTASGLGADLADLRRAADGVLRPTFGAPDQSTWSARQPLVDDALTRLRDLGVRRVVVPDRGLSSLRASVAGRATLARPFQLRDANGETVSAAVADAGLATHFRPGRQQVLLAHRLLADLAVLYFDAPGNERGVVVRPPAGWHADAAFLTRALDAIGRSPILTPVTLDRFFDDVPALGTTRAPVVRTTTASAGKLPRTVSRTRRDLLALRSLTDTTDALRPMRSLVFAAEADRATARQRRRLLDAAAAQVSLVRQRVHLVGGRSFRLTAREGTIPLTVVNDNAFPVRVSVELSSEKLQFSGTSTPDRGRRTFAAVPLGANQRSVLAVPVRARTSAKFSLRAVLRSPDGELELGRSRFTVIATAVSGLGIALSLAAGVFLAAWWGRHWRTARRSKRLVDQ